MLAVALPAIFLSVMTGSGSGYGFQSRECRSISSVFALTVCVILTACCTNSVAIDDVEACSNKTISMPPTFVLESESITLVCHDVEARARDMYFTKGRNINVSEEFTEILNTSAIQMTLPPITRDDLGSPAESLSFKCMDASDDKCIGIRNVRIEYYPVEAKNVTCRVYGWKTMECWWSLWMLYKRPNNIDLTCDFAGDNNYLTEMLSKEKYSAWAKCPNLNQTSCIWDADHFKNPFSTLHLRIQVTNKYRKDAVVHTNITFDVDNIVQLYPVDKSLIKLQKLEDANCLALSWPVTEEAKRKTLTFKLTYSTPCTGSKTVDVSYHKDDGGLVSTNLCSLHPHSTYSASISGRFIQSDLWSEPASFEFKTDKQVPKHSPQTTAGLYEHTEEPEYNNRLYFTPLGDCELNSESRHVEYQAFVDGEQKFEPHPVFYTNLKVNKEPVTVTLQAKNDVGDSKTDSIIIFPKHTGLKPSDLTVEFSDKDDDVVHLTIEGRDARAKGHTVVWCTGATFCEKPVNWKKLHSTKQTLQISNSQGHRFGLITEHQADGYMTNTGIIWEKCLYQRGKVPGSPPRNVHRSDQQPAEGFTLEWLPYECSDGYIHHYQLSYCEGTIGNQCNCTSQISQVNVSKQETSHTVKGLPAGSHVCVWLQGVSHKGSGPQSDPVAFTTTAVVQSPWLYIGLALAIVVTIGLIVLVCCCYRRCCKRLKDKTKIKRIDIERLSGRALLDNGTKPYHGHGTEMKQIPVPQTVSLADSGASSLSTESRSQSTIPKQRNSDSAISSDLSQQGKAGQPVTYQSKTSVYMSCDGLDSYQKASAVSAGGSNPGSYMKVTCNDSDLDSHCVADNVNNNVLPREDNCNIERPITERSKLINCTPDDQSLNEFLSDLEEDDNTQTEYNVQDISDILGD